MSANALGAANIAGKSMAGDGQIPKLVTTHATMSHSARRRSSSVRVAQVSTVMSSRIGCAKGRDHVRDALKQ
jgi:hypothetical protein